MDTIWWIVLMVGAFLLLVFLILLGVLFYLYRTGRIQRWLADTTKSAVKGTVSGFFKDLFRF